MFCRPVISHISAAGCFSCCLFFFAVTSHVQLSSRKCGARCRDNTRDGLKAVLSRQRQRSRQRRGKAAMSLTETRQGRGRGRELEAEARQTKFKARTRRGDPWKNLPSSRCIAVPNLVALSQTVWQRVNGLVAPPSWAEVIFYVIPLYGVSRGLNLNLSSMGGRSLKLTDYYRAEATRYLSDRVKTEAETMRPRRGRAS